ncbi:phosphate propanoyltransferase [Vallitaleaceae bacterium 9-2]
MAVTTNALEALVKEAVMQQIKQKTTANVLKQSQPALTVPVGVSARHLHVTREHLDILFGKGHQLHVKKELMGGQFAAEERVTIVGMNLRVIENVRILGPERSATQVEVSKTDARQLGLNAPIRESGDIEGSMPITIVGPAGAVRLEQGCIVAQRHIHMTPEDAKRLGVKDKQIVSVKTQDGTRKGILSNVLVRVHDTYRLEMHIDTDEANAFGIQQSDQVTIVH